MRPAGHEPRRAAESAPGASSEHGHGERSSPSPSFYESDLDDDGGDELEDFVSYPQDPTQLPQPGFSGIVHEPTSASNLAGTLPKPKRTRQLTTPYQAEVLHQLLAESRFPSTAKREEVGRKIGLSARKVQVWFQNQRQKAKKEAKDAQAAAAAAAAAAAPLQPPAPHGGSPYTYVPHPPYSATRDPASAGSSSSRTWQPRPIDPREIPPLPSVSPSADRNYPAWPRRTSASDEGPSPVSPASFGGQRRAPLTGPGIPGVGTSRASLSPTTRYNPRPDFPQLPPLHTVTPPLPSLLSRESRGYASGDVFPLPPLRVGERRQSVPELASSRSDISRVSLSDHGLSALARTGSSQYPLGSQMTGPDPSSHWSSAGPWTQRAPPSRYSQSYSPRPSSSLGSPAESREPPEHFAQSAPTRSSRFDPVRNAEEVLSAERHSRRVHSRSPDDD